MPSEIRPLRKRFGEYILFGFYFFPVAIVLGLVLASGIPERLLAIAGFYLVFGVIIAETRHAAQNTAAAFFDGLQGVSGASTPYSYDYSREQSMVIRGDIAGALASYESHMAESPGNVDVRLRAAELYATKGAAPRRAAELFSEARRIEGATTEQDVYATNRLIDLYRGVLGDPGRALVELRRLIDRHPGTVVAARAREALAELKSTAMPAEPPGV